MLAQKKLFTIHQAKTHFSQLVARAASGEEIIIAKGGLPMARLVPLPCTSAPRTPGSARGEIHLSDECTISISDELLDELLR